MPEETNVSAEQLSDRTAGGSTPATAVVPEPDLTKPVPAQSPNKELLAHPCQFQRLNVHEICSPINGAAVLSPCAGANVMTKRTVNVSGLCHTT